MPRGSNHQPTCYSPRPQVLVLVTRPELVVGPACSQQTVTNKRQVVTLQMMFFDLCPCERDVGVVVFMFKGGFLGLGQVD